MSARTAPSPKTVVKTDYLSLVGAFFPPIGIAVAAAGALGVLPDKHRSIAEGKLVMAGKAGPDFFLLMAAAFVVGGLALLAWRFARIRGAFASGHRVPGTVTKLTPFKDRAYVHYEYTVHGQQIRTRHFAHQTELYERLREGQPVTVAVDPARPEVGFVVELFEDRAG